MQFLEDEMCFHEYDLHFRELKCPTRWEPVVESKRLSQEEQEEDRRMRLHTFSDLTEHAPHVWLLPESRSPTSAQ